jgi:hypothetical protein
MSARRPNRTIAALVVLVMLAAPFVSVTPASAQSQLGSPPDCRGHHGEKYLLVGGENGTWFRTTQWPKLFQIYLPSKVVTKLTVTPQPGDIWSGGWNGSQWLISGAGGGVAGTNTSDPFIYLYDGCEHIVAGTQYLWGPQASWHGGDVFASSYNGSHWLLSGLGSDMLPGNGIPTNHMALGTFDGYKFTDFSGNVPNQQQSILYANSWNGHYWLVGGGFVRTGVLFAFGGHDLTDLSVKFASAVSSLGSVQSIVWNGNYWLVGGVGFLVKYDGKTFMNLTPELNDVLSGQHALGTCCNAVNALAWDGMEWMIGGGLPIAILGQRRAWLATYNGAEFTDISPKLPYYISNPTYNSSILRVSYSPSSWIIGGYANGRGILLSYAGGFTTDMSYLVGGDMSTVNFVGAGSFQSKNIPEYPWPSIITTGSLILAFVQLRRKKAPVGPREDAA